MGPDNRAIFLVARLLTRPWGPGSPSSNYCYLRSRDYFHEFNDRQSGSGGPDRCAAKVMLIMGPDNRAIFLVARLLTRPWGPGSPSQAWLVFPSRGPYTGGCFPREHLPRDLPRLPFKAGLIFQPNTSLRIIEQFSWLLAC
jgi:hypothetical protein